MHCSSDSRRFQLLTTVMPLLLLAILAASPAMSGNIVCVPNPQQISLADLPGSGTYKDVVVIRYTGGASGNVYGYSIDLTWNPLVITAGAGDFAKPGSGPFAASEWFIPRIITEGHARIDASLPGGSAGTTADDLFKVTFTAVDTPDYATSALTLTVNYLRDPDNAPVTGGVPENGQVIVDLVAPSVTLVAIENTTLTHTNDYVKNTDALSITATVTDGDPGFVIGNIKADLTGLGGAAVAAPVSYSSNVATWTVAAATCTPANGTVTVTVTGTDPLGNGANANDTIIADNTAPSAVTNLTAAPGHKKVLLAWDNASGQDTYYAGVVIRYTLWDDYPNYATAPAYPANQTVGDGEAFNGTGAAATHSFTTDDRGIYYYSAFVYDIARNYSAVTSGGQKRATNYWLGDVSNGTYGTYDGLVNTADYTALASTYGLPSGVGFKDECDVGPTDNHSRVGIPTPDDWVQFEDLMIFAMNAGVVGPAKAAPTGTAEPLLAWERQDDHTWSLQLVEPCANLKGVNVAAQLPAGAATVTAGALLGQQDGPVFLKNIDRLGLDAGLALMGQDRGIVGSGELLRVSLAEGQEFTGAAIAARGIANEDFRIEPQVPTDLPLPGRYSLEQNSPNPFNPQTKIMFNLPEAVNVQLVVYTLDGRRIRTLLDETQPAGNHEVIWDGRDDGGRQMASGSYVYRLDAGPYSETKKMSLMK